ncbi:hypothetical protein PIB30_086572 [Stylosanthes scabra]|uniref:Uncharacterized protein n=1 Tax=Stylosanthes scabra TaxID=79078 RepID=A0ABU6QUD8_9FABA|nr:hypothetical protein [Stylosanthes scabra]
MVNQDEEGVPYTDHSGDEQHQNPQPNPQQVDLDLNATANGSQESAGRNAETDGAQSGDRSGGQRSTSAFDRLGSGNPEPRPFGGIGDETRSKGTSEREYGTQERRPRLESTTTFTPPASRAF